VADRLDRLSRFVTPLAVGPRERRRGIVEGAEQRAETDQHLVAPDEVREPKVEPAAFVRDELHAARDLAVDEGEYLAALIVEAERTRRAVEPLALDVLTDRRRPATTRSWCA
jgi:hypothetical protein